MIFLGLLLACGPPPMSELIAPPPPPEARALRFSELRRSPPEGFVDLEAQGTRIQLDPRYATDRNLTGAPLPGLGVPGVWLRAEAAAALEQVQSELETEDLGLRLVDSYRPVRARLALEAWARRTGQEALIASGHLDAADDHARGIGIDVLLIDLRRGEPVEMDSPWEDYSPNAQFNRAEWPASDYRQLLREALRKHGFRGEKNSWWHYTYTRVERGPALDEPYGCFEEPAGAWQPPASWDRPRWAPTPPRRPERCPEPSAGPEEASL